MKVESHLLHGDCGRCVSLTIEDAKHVETRSVEYAPGQCTQHVKFFLRSAAEADAILNAVAKARTLLAISTPLRAAGERCEHLMWTQIGQTPIGKCTMCNCHLNIKEHMLALAATR